MKIGLLECDHVSKKYQHIGGDYRDMFASLLPEVDFKFYDACNGEFPKSLDDCDGYMCTGSRHSVYDDIDWVKQLKVFVLQLYKNQKLFVGVCFGHQMMGEALGGKVQKSTGGWNVGVHHFEMLGKKDWMDPFQKEINLLMMCQDQVVEMPKDSVLLAKTAYCQVGMFMVGKTMLGVQAHPEFPIEYEKVLLLERDDRIGKEKVEKAMESLKTQPDRELLVRWIMNFLNR